MMFIRKNLGFSKSKKEPKQFLSKINQIEEEIKKDEIAIIPNGWTVSTHDYCVLKVLSQ